MNEVVSDLNKGYQSSLLSPLFRAVATSVAVASVLYPIDIVKTRMRTGLPLGLGFLMPFLSNYRFLTGGFLKANQASLIKNSVISNRDTVAEQVGSVVSETSAEPMDTKYHSLFLTTAIIASLDTLLTQYYSNRRELYSLGHNPELRGWQKLNLAKTGMAIRGSKNFITTLGCISSATILSETIDPWLPAKQYGLAHSAATNIISGYLVAYSTNWMDVLYCRKLHAINFQTLATPSYRDIARQLWQTDGLRGFTRGSFIGGLYTTLAFATINAASYWVDNKLAQNRIQAPRGIDSFFAVKPAIEQSHPSSSVRSGPAI